MRNENENGGAYAEHQKAWELLPWYVNGTLEPEEWVSVSRHLASCTACVREVTSLERLGELLRGSEDLALSPDESFAALEAQLDASERDRAPTGFGRRLVGRIVRAGRDLAVAPVTAQRLLVAQALLVVILAAGLVWQLAGADALEYRTLSDSRMEEAYDRESDLLVIFDRAASVSEMEALLTEIEGALVGGPTARGLYEVRLAKGSIVEDALATLRASGIVSLAEPTPRLDPQ